MDCTVRGPGIDQSNPTVAAVVVFDPSEDGPTGTITTTGLTSAGTFELRCIEPNSGVNFVEILQIEVIGTTQEI